MKISLNWHLKEVKSYSFPDIKWGAWGGGWNYKLGIAVSGSEIMLELIVLSVHLNWGKQDED